MRPHLCATSFDKPLKIRQLAASITTNCHMRNEPTSWRGLVSGICHRVWGIRSNAVARRGFVTPHEEYRPLADVNAQPNRTLVAEHVRSLLFTSLIHLSQDAASARRIRCRCDRQCSAVGVLTFPYGMRLIPRTSGWSRSSVISMPALQGKS